MLDSAWRAQQIPAELIQAVIWPEIAWITTSCAGGHSNTGNINEASIMAVGGSGAHHPHVSTFLCLRLSLTSLQGGNMFFEFNFQDDKEDPYMSTTSISDLSTEILVIVLSFLPIEDLSRYINLHTSVLSSFSQTSSYIHYI